MGGSEIHNCYNIGIIEAKSYAGIIAKQNTSSNETDSIIENCYYIQTDEINSSLSAVGGSSTSGSVINSTMVKKASSFSSGEVNAKYLEGVKVLKNDEIRKIVSNYYYTDENKQYALLSIKLDSNSETTVRAEIVASENSDETAAENFYKFLQPIYFL